DTLDENTSYTITVAGIKDASSNCITDSTNTFTTAQELPVNSVTKTSVSSEEDGGTTQIELLINMEIEALPAVEVAMSESGAAEPAATADADCVASGDDTLCTVTVSGVAGCATPTDYEVTLSAEGYEDYVIHFNSADNEFEEATTVSDNDCWIQDHSAGDADNEFDWSASGGNLVMTMDNLGTGSHDIYYDQPFADSKEGAFVVYISDLETPATNGTNFDLVMVQATNSQFDGLNGIVSGYNGLADPAYSGWGSVYEGGNGYQWGIPLETGDLNDIADVYDGYYICMTAYDDLLTTYISTDGDNYYKLTEDNMRCDTGTSCNIDQIDSRSIADWDDLRLSIQVGSDNGAGDGTLTAKFGFARFRTSNLNGSMADCPRMNR
ncbi:MAG TPA: hypothetical protein VJC18_11560, partial [bacterium]|nr:hypothetical protein [bacterium]